MLSASPPARGALDRRVGFWKTVAWSGLVLAGALHMAAQLKTFPSDAVPIWFLAADSTSGSFAEIKFNEVRATRDGSAADDAEGAKLFGMETAPIPEGALSYN